MHISVEPSENHAILHLRGEFDTYYCPMLQEEIDGIVKSGVRNVVLNLRMVKFINSTALGAIIKASKALGVDGGKLAISRPSPFCKDILEKVGLDRVVPVFDSDEEAVGSVTTAEDSTGAEKGDAVFEEDSSSVLFAMQDTERLRHFVPSAKSKNPVHGHAFGDRWVGRMSSLDENGLGFTWNGGSTDLSPFDMGQMLAIGTGLRVKFRLPLLQRGYCEAGVEVTQIEERADAVKVGCAFVEIDDETRDAVRQYSKDMAFLKEELRKATDG